VVAKVKAKVHFAGPVRGGGLAVSKTEFTGTAESYLKAVALHSSPNR